MFVCVCVETERESKGDQLSKRVNERENKTVNERNKTLYSDRFMLLLSTAFHSFIVSS